MNRIYLLLFCFSFVSTSFLYGCGIFQSERLCGCLTCSDVPAPTPIEHPLVAKAEIIDVKDEKSVSGDRWIRYYFRMEIVNTTDTAVRYWIMNCSTTDNIILTRDELSMTIIPCDKNFPVIQEILPHQKTMFSLSFFKYIPKNGIVSTYVDRELGIGFIFVDGGVYRTKEDYQKVLNNTDRYRDAYHSTIWCPVIDIGEINKKFGVRY